ncbi:MAG: hypothetical protein PWP24_733 [Clostridiales bacterium]|nr:hypothetical protein [Clostridiales bacterium]
MLYEIGGLFGWLLIIAYVGTMLNYVIKFVKKNWGKRISSTEQGKKFLNLLMKVFVRNHKYFGFAAAFFLILHFAIQFSTFGFNPTGAIAAGLLLLQVFLGMYATANKKKRAGAWFVMHRSIALLLILGIALHLLSPSLFKASSVATTASTMDTGKSFTLDELATYNGQNGQPAYVAYKGVVYDVTDQPKWTNGQHNGQVAGTDLTDEISKSPHGDKVFESLPVVGTLQ